MYKRQLPASGGHRLGHIDRTMGAKERAKTQMHDAHAGACAGSAFQGFSGHAGLQLSSSFSKSQSVGLFHKPVGQVMRNLDRRVGIQPAGGDQTGQIGAIYPPCDIMPGWD